MRTKNYGVVAAFTCLMLLSACESPTGPVSESGTDGDVLPGQPQFDPKVTVCNPWGNDDTALDRGIVARLTYMPPGICADENGTALPGRPKQAASYLSMGIDTDVTVFFSRLFVPTRYFDRGFETQDGTTVLNASGQPMYEWFGVELLTQLKLAPGEEEGDYQLAVLSDDGAVVYLDSPSGPISFINNDGEHATKMGCANTPIHLTANTKIPIRVQYYQGPRFHISLVLMWRKWPTGDRTYPGDSVWEYRDDANRKLCGQSSGEPYGYSSNTYYFTSGNAGQPAATPTSKFYEMLANGWKVLENQNYGLVDDIASNPCRPPEDPLIISGVVISNILQTSATVLWSTNIAANSTAIVKNPSTGAVVATFTDSAMVTDHSLNMTGLASNTLFAVEVVSVSASGQTVTSSQFAFKTRR